MAKVDRAEIRLDELADEWRAFLDTNPWPSWVDDRTEPGWHSVYFDFSTPPPPRFSVVVGEIAHDLRSALDHLAWREAVECVGLQQAESDAAIITFPVAKNASDFKSANTLKYVGENARAVMQRHQPYQRVHRKEPPALGLLHWFNRMDKHRTVQVTAVGAPSIFTMGQIKAFTRGAKIAAAGGPDPKVEVHRTPPLSPSFGDPPPDLRVSRSPSRSRKSARSSQTSPTSCHSGR